MKKKYWYLVTTSLGPNKPHHVVECETMAAAGRSERKLKKMGYKKTIIWFREGCLAYNHK